MLRSIVNACCRRAPPARTAGTAFASTMVLLEETASPLTSYTSAKPTIAYYTAR